MAKGQTHGFSDIVLNPSEQIKRHIVQLSKDCTEHLSKSDNGESERYAFAMKTWVFSIMLEPYSPAKVLKPKMDHYKELEEKIKEINNDKSLSDENKKKTVNKVRFAFALPVFEQTVRILQNSKIVEVEVEGIINIESSGIRERVQMGEGIVDYKKRIPLRKPIELDETVDETGDKDVAITD